MRILLRSAVSPCLRGRGTMTEELLSTRLRAQQERPEVVGGETELVEAGGDGGSPELLDKLRALEDENIVLTLVNDSQRKAYENCLDE
ncbi:nck-associated protein 5-like, partial [Cetorhinus maximus]